MAREKRRKGLCVRCVGWWHFENDVIPTEFAGVRAGRRTEGHRLLGKPASLPSAALYHQMTRAAEGNRRSGEREDRIREQLGAALKAIRNARWRDDKALLNTVVNLSEWPSVIAGSFRSKLFESAGRGFGHGDARPSKNISPSKTVAANCCRTFFAVLNTEAILMA